MRVLQIAHCYYPPFLDCARQYAALFKNSPYKVLTVYLTGAPDASVAEATQSDEVIFLNYTSAQVSGLKLGAIAKIKQLVAKETFAFCITHRSKPTYIALLATSLPVISVHHNYGDFDRFSRRILVNLFKKRLLLIGVSNSVRDEMRAHLPNWPAEKIQTLYNRIDLKATQASFVSRADARSFLNLPQDVFIFANVGRLHHDKDQATLLNGFSQALPHLPAGSRLVIMGKGPLESTLKAQAQQLGIMQSVVFTGNVPDARRHFKAFDVFVLTSDHEPFGMVLLEAMAAQLPIICSDSGGGAEVVNGVGDLFPLGNAKALAECMLKMATIEVDVTKIDAKLKTLFTDEAVGATFCKMVMPTIT
jgi:glycosyltransferase involved in cell wall biosynthesis